MVLLQVHMAPQDTYRGGMGKMETTQAHPNFTCQKIIRYISHPKIACGKGKMMARQITSGHLFGYFSSMRRRVSAAIKMI
jgi:hypothetical protein